MCVLFRDKELKELHARGYGTFFFLMSVVCGRTPTGHAKLGICHLSQIAFTAVL